MTALKGFFFLKNSSQGIQFFFHFKRTGRWRSERFLHLIIWKLFHRIFSFKFELHGISWEEIHSTEAKIFACYPHGVFSSSAILWATHEKMLKKAKYIGAASLALSVPLVRELFLAMGCISADKKTLVKLLNSGKDIILFPEGVQGMVISFAKLVN